MPFCLVPLFLALFPSVGLANNCLFTRLSIHPESYWGLVVDREGGSRTEFMRTDRTLHELLKDTYPPAMLTDLPGKRVLDAGAGGGALVKDLSSGKLVEEFPELKGTPPVNAIGIDLAPRPGRAGSKPWHWPWSKPPAPPPAVPLVKGDLVKLPFASGSMDVILSSYSLFYYEYVMYPQAANPNEALARAALLEFQRVLKPGGVIRLSSFNLSGELRFRNLVETIPGLKWKRRVPTPGNASRVVIELEKTEN